MARILECFDSELVERTKVALDEAAVVYSMTVLEEQSLTGWQIDVSDADLAKAAAMAEAAAQAVESERSLMRCSHCGTGMIVVGPASEAEKEEPLFIEYRCPKCGAPGLSNLA